MKMIAMLLALTPLFLTACAASNGGGGMLRPMSTQSAQPGGTISCPEGMAPVNGQCASTAGGLRMK